MIEVVKKPFFEDGTVYIGRGSPLGNPWTCKESHHPQARFKAMSRTDAISKFKTYFENALLDCDPTVCEEFKKIQCRYFRGENIFLECFCAPKRCHGDIIKSKIESCRYIINWFSNMQPFDKPFEYKGIEFRTPEHLYQSMKFENKLDKVKIASLNPYAGKKEAHKMKSKQRGNWEDIKIEVMERALRYKFNKDSSWGTKLRSTTEDIVELNNWGDVFWGEDIFTNKGKNILGILLMDIRNDIQ